MKSKRLIKFGAMGLAAIIVLGGGFFAYTKFTAPPPAPPPVVKKAAPAAPAAPAAQPGPTPSDTANALAQAPVNAINKAKEAAASQADKVATSDALLADVGSAAKGAPGGTKAAPPATKSSSTVTNVAPGLSATTPVDAAVEASPAFRSFVANAKVSGAGVVNGTARVFINGRLTRGGENVDVSLGIVFEGVDLDRKLLVFKDQSGATVARKY